LIAMFLKKRWKNIHMKMSTQGAIKFLKSPINEIF
jgi:hypothetical protein